MLRITQRVPLGVTSRHPGQRRDRHPIGGTGPTPRAVTTVAPAWVPDARSRAPGRQTLALDFATAQRRCDIPPGGIGSHAWPGHGRSVSALLGETPGGLGEAFRWWPKAPSRGLRRTRWTLPHHTGPISTTPLAGQADPLHPPSARESGRQGPVRPGPAPRCEDPPPDEAGS